VQLSRKRLASLAASSGSAIAYGILYIFVALRVVGQKLVGDGNKLLHSYFKDNIAVLRYSQHLCYILRPLSLNVEIVVGGTNH
jgi:hypothetical protein